MVRLPGARLTEFVGRRSCNPKAARSNHAPRKNISTSFRRTVITQRLVCYFLIAAFPIACPVNLLQVTRARKINLAATTTSPNYKKLSGTIPTKYQAARSVADSSSSYAVVSRGLHRQPSLQFQQVPKKKTFHLCLVTPAVTRSYKTESLFSTKSCSSNRIGL